MGIMNNLFGFCDIPVVGDRAGATTLTGNRKEEWDKYVARYNTLVPKPIWMLEAERGYQTNTEGT